MRRPSGEKVHETFAGACAPDIKIRPPRSARSKQTSRLSVRIDDRERAYLERFAGELTLSAYARATLLGEMTTPKKERPKKRARKPKTEHAALARLMALLGQSRLASNLNQIAKAAHLGALPVTPDLEDELRAACKDISLMRQLLLKGLGMRNP